MGEHESDAGQEAALPTKAISLIRLCDWLGTTLLSVTYRTAPHDVVPMLTVWPPLDVANEVCDTV